MLVRLILVASFFMVPSSSSDFSLKRHGADSLVSPNGLNFYEALSDLQDMMASMTKIFGPFLLQNLTLLLLYWLLHVFNLCLTGYYIFANLSDTTISLQCLGFAGSALIVRLSNIVHDYMCANSLMKYSTKMLWNFFQ